MPCPLLIFSQSDYLIQIVHINSHTYWQTVQIQIRSQLIWIYTVCKDMVYPGSAGQGLNNYNNISHVFHCIQKHLICSWSFTVLCLRFSFFFLFFFFILLLYNCWASWNQITYGASMGFGNESLCMGSGAHGQDGHYAPNFKEFGWAYCFGLVHAFVGTSPFPVSMILQKLFELGPWNLVSLLCMMNYAPFQLWHFVWTSI